MNDEYKNTFLFCELFRVFPPGTDDFYSVIIFIISQKSSVKKILLLYALCVNFCINHKVY